MCVLAESAGYVWIAKILKTKNGWESQVPIGLFQVQGTHAGKGKRTK